MKQFGSPAEIIIITPPFSIWAIRLLQAQTHTQGSLGHWFHSTFSLTLLVGSTYEGSEVQKAANLVNTFMLFFPHPVRIFVQKVFPTLFKAFYAKFRPFLCKFYAFGCTFCAYFSEAKSTLVLIHTFLHVCEGLYTKSLLSLAVDLFSEFWSYDSF